MDVTLIPGFHLGPPSSGYGAQEVECRLNFVANPRPIPPTRALGMYSVDAQANTERQGKSANGRDVLATGYSADSPRAPLDITQQYSVLYSVSELHLPDQRITLLTRSLHGGRYARNLGRSCLPAANPVTFPLPGRLGDSVWSGQPGWRVLVNAASVPRGNP